MKKCSYWINQINRLIEEATMGQLGPAPTPAGAMVLGQPVEGKSIKSTKKKVKVKESGEICKVIKSYIEKDMIENDVLFEGNKEECEQYAKINKLPITDYNKRKKLGKRPQYFIREFTIHTYDKNDKSYLKRNQAIITNSNIGDM